jgi:hypothetical protein
LFDAAGKFCHRSAVRRLVAVVLMLVFVAATAAPAFALCRLRAAPHECCCQPAPPNSICAPDCCATARPAHPVAAVTTQLRGLAFVAAPTLGLCLPFDRAASLSPPTSGALVALHERAPPRLPLRI